MSLRMMMVVEERDFPAEVRSILLIIADEAGDLEEVAIADPYRYSAYIAWRTGLSKRCVSDVLNQLEELAWLIPTNSGRFRLDLSEAPKKASFSEYSTRPVDPDDWDGVMREAPFWGAAERLNGRKGRFSV